MGSSYFTQYRSILTVVNNDPGDESALVQTTDPDLRVLSLPENLLSATCLELPAGIPLDQWLEIGRSIGTVSEAARWWIGDFLIYGDEQYGQGHTQIFDPESAVWSWETLRQYRWVAERVPQTNRLPPEKLSWSHHRAVAVLEEQEQPGWLQLAIDEKWSVRELKAAIAQSKEPGEEVGELVVSNAPHAEVTALSSGRIGQMWDEEAHLMLCLYLGVTA